MKKKNHEDLITEVQELSARLEEAQETLDAIRRGEVDGLVISTPTGDQVYSLSGAEKPYRVLIEQMREGAVTISDDHTILYCNNGFAKMMKRSMEKIIGVKIESMVSPTCETAFRKLLSSAKTGKSAISTEITLQAKDKTLVPTQMSINSLHMDNIISTFIVITDLTEHMDEEVKRYTNELELAQIALSESEQRWATTLKSIGDAVIASDLSGKITFMNGVAENLTGWSLGEASHKPVKDVFRILNAQTRLEAENPVNRVLKEGLVVGLANHTILVRKDGVEVPIDDSGAPIKDKDGKTTGVVLIFRDITERKKAEAKIEEQLHMLDLAHVIVRDSKDEIIFWNSGVRKMYGFSKEEAVGKKPYELLKTKFPKPIEQIKEELFQNGLWEGELVHTKADGSSIFVASHWVLHKDENGKPVAIIEVNNDITERKKAEGKLEKIRRNLEKLVEERTKKLALSSLYARNLIEASLDPLVTISIEGKITDVNKATELATGCSRHELIGSDFSDYFTEPEKAKIGYKQVLIEGFVRDYPLAIRHKSGRITDVSYNATVYRSEAGEIQGVFAAARDVTELKKAEEQAQEAAKKLKDAERLSAIGATAGMVGHDIRNPLQAISGDLYLAEEELKRIPSNEGREAMQESLTEIEKNIDYISKIVADLQDFARPLQPNLEEADLKLIIDDLLSKNCLPENVKVSVKVEGDARKVVTDSSYINRIMYNLVNNASQAMPEGGKLTVHVYKRANDSFITISDTGVGIPESTKSKLFTPMFTTKAKGQGFGLVVVKRMTEALGGTVTFESQEGKGTTFIVRFPLGIAKRSDT